MFRLVKIALRNLFRYKRRTILTMSLITIGVAFVLVFVSVTASFKAMMVGEITDSMLGHIQVHKKGYVASIDNLPLNLNLKLPAFQKVEKKIAEIPEIEAFSPRIKFGGVFSNFVESTNIRLNAVDPEKEWATVPLLPSRIISGSKTIRPGEILVPELLAKGMKVGVGDTAVVVATNEDGSVNGYQFTVGGILRSVTGPGGRDGYIHIEDGRQILRMEEPEISEVAIRLKKFSTLENVAARLQETLGKEINAQGKPAFEIHTWKKLTPFFNIVRMIDVMTFFIKLMLIAIVLISVMNVMIMAVYERTREIGTIAAIGTLPGRILSLFVIEGLSLGLLGAASGTVFGGLAVIVLNAIKIKFNFGRQQGLILALSLNVTDILTISLIVVGVAVLAGFQPAFRASRLEPIKALRHV
ncbi:MAG: ABC transporter permease [Candidatus Aminicenantes bacterium]|nr:ABC transporter permease [Candidatus Aminicenantes bacterium]